jgi:hypothetical protein
MVRITVEFWGVDVTVSGTTIHERIIMKRRRLSVLAALGLAVAGFVVSVVAIGTVAQSADGPGAGSEPATNSSIIKPEQM